MKDIYINSDINAVTKKIHTIYYEENQAKHKKFATHVKKIATPHIITELLLWFPEDGIKITLLENKRKIPIKNASAGQKNAAILSFILSYGTEPLLLDQPEDDLDNELIYSLIVQQLRKTKSKRQVIIVTHNANIVVNADAEMVFPLRVETGETLTPETGSIQNQNIRKKICDILEGGQYAFQQRYKRIHLEN
ncbi:AAA family ATPase [Candidatus Venteria ishoeyi]|uniref:ATPase AAA-type core domain-containing protein n=1 Tax=Candidatus Venteria ishoeyi TaxID=1899563 RepID=A0A1H6FC66_9GAMM|nr:AAA family ATPase [Candidatus Venteria ishoeyi]SEH07668.1 Uncharacterised protein [Candidatus Venteria ishoeyi]